MINVKRIIIAVLVVFMFFTIIGIIFVIKSKDLEELDTIQIVDVDLNKVNNGEFEGSYKAFPISVKVLVTVNNHKITDIKLLKHQTGQGQGAKEILNTIITEQTLKVDTITGATYSSKVILLAVQNALDSAVKNK